MKDFVKRIVLALSTGYILFYFSELVFWAKYRPDSMAPGELFFTYVIYSLVTFVFLSILWKFRVQDIWGLILAGSVYGWLVEGVVVQTMYDVFPLQISWTGLAWHALISVVLGWYYVKKTVGEHSYGKTLTISLLIGLFYGFWAITWWVEDQVIVPLGEFSLYLWSSSILLMVSYAITDLIQVDSYTPSQVEKGIVLIVLGFFFAATVWIQPLALFILPSLLIITWKALQKNTAPSSEQSYIQLLQGDKNIMHYGILLCIPAITTVVYACALSLSILFPTNIVVYMVLTPLGFACYMLAILKIVKK
jgi:hypothetical protein